MKKIFILCVLLYSVNLFSQVVTNEEAGNVAINYMRSHYSAFIYRNINDSLNTSKDSINVQTLSLSGKCTLYKVEFAAGGWALVSPNKQMEPILAVSYEDDFPEIDDMPEGMKWLFSYYEEVAASITKSDTIQHPNWLNKYNGLELVRSGEEKISAFDNIKWGQSHNNTYSFNNPYCNRKYNKYCPAYYFTTECGHTVTGCGAVAIGQVMKYYQWPKYALVPDSIITDTIHKIASFPYPITMRESYYDWDVIPNALYRNSNVQQEDAVSLLLRDCGYATRTYYGEKSSRTYNSDIINALKTYFGYSTSIQNISRSSFNDTVFIPLLKNEIDNQRPVLYYGSGYNNNSIRVGHMFILYGYDNSNKFFINWGYNGNYQSTLYTLDVLKPGVNNPNYNIGQGAIIHVAPNYCTQQKVNPDEEWSQSFTKQYPGNIIIGNRTIASNQQGTVTAGNSIRLTNGFVIAQGADVTMSIDGTPCEDLPDLANNSIPNYHQEESTANVPTRNSIIKIKDRDVIPLSIRQTDDFLSLECGSELSHIILYDIFGKLVMQAHEPTINVSQLPEGIYILQAVTADGQVMQDKFIRTK